MSKIPLTCCIITLNEADRIGRTIDAIQYLCDEIIVADSGSTDDTVNIAKTHGAKVFHKDWQGYGPQKRFAEDMAQNDWILSLDADEVMTPDLAKEIAALLDTQPELKAYRFRIRNVYPGKTKPRLWAGVDYNNVRLYDRRFVRFDDSPVHDSVDTKSYAVGQLAGSVNHFSARSFEHIKQKLDSYSDLQSKSLKKPIWQILARIPFEYPFVFIKYYLLRCHFTGGFEGIYIAHIAAHARLNRLLKMLRAKSLKDKQ